jgi:fatty-acyl-CoA synthase
MTIGLVEQQTESQPRRGKPSAARSWLKAIELTSRIEADPRRLFADVVEKWARKQPDRPALISGAETRISRYAR